MQKLTGYPSSSLWYAKLGSSITGLVMACHFPKVIKRAGGHFERCRRQVFITHAVAVPVLLNMCFGYTQDQFRTSQTIAQHTVELVLRRF